MKLSQAFKTEQGTRNVFSWLTRIGAAPKFGSRPIGWYQMHQCKAIEILETFKFDTLRCKHGVIQGQLGKGRWFTVITVRDLYANADAQSRS